MKFTLNWLKEYLDTDASLEKICETLTDIGLEVEDVVDRAAHYQGLTVAKVIEREKHPNADRLNLCLVNNGTEQIQVVCGAKNVEKGQHIVLAVPGTIIPQSGQALKAGVIRDVESNGMICSESELNLADESEGILVLPESAPIGQSFADYMGFNDPMIEINLTPNRADCAGVYGIARDLAAAGLGKLKTIAQQPVPGLFDSTISVTTKDTHACPYFIGRTIRNVKNGPSPKWLQDYLRGIGLKPISALVDITNYLCLGMNRPLHVFDADKLTGNLHVRLSNKGETLKALNDKEYTLDDSIIVVADDKGAQALGGIMGGLDSSCSAETSTIFLECALFNEEIVRRSGQSLQIDSDAKYRFERGVDPAFLDEGIEIATRLILDICGGEPSYTVVAGAQPDWYRTISFDPALVAKRGGLSVDDAEQLRILMALGCQVRPQGGDSDILDVTPPSWRNDIQIPEDLVEEVLRLHGYDKIPAVPLARPTNVTHGALSSAHKRSADMRRLSAQRGLHEVVTWSFLSPQMADLFTHTDTPQIPLANPISADLSVMRQSILPNLLNILQRNEARGMGDLAIFEQGNVFLGTNPDQQPAHLSLIRSGQATSRHVQGSPRNVDIFDIKADVWALLQQCGLNPENMTLSRTTPAWYHPGQSGALSMGKFTVAVFGTIHPAITQALDISVPVVAAEIYLDRLPASKKKSATKAALTLSPYQSATRDFAFLMNADVAAADIVKAVKNTDKNLLQSVTVFDDYRGKGIEAGQKSIAFSIILQPSNANLTEADIDGVAKKVVAAVEKLGGSLRG
jgi:phenylalanyl-tRNA synthetase beta chain